MTTTTTKAIALTIPEVRVLANDLLATLAECIGDADEIAEVLTHWLDELDPAVLGLVAMAAVQSVFVECLTITEPADWPPGGIAFTPADSEETP